MGDKNLQDLKGKGVVVYDDDHEGNQECIQLQHPPLQFQYYIAPGFKFLPSDDELVFIYLTRKIQDPEGFQPPFIPVMNVYDYLPRELLEENEDKDAYFFTPRNKIYENGSRAARTVKGGPGYWRAGPPKKEIKDVDDRTAAYKNSLRFFQGKSKKTDGTDWQMKEFVMCQDEKEKAGCSSSSSMKLDDWVLTHIYLKKNGGD
ncbi:NAC domain-containing protein 2-like [Papaver somniferum]|uniref:NAC domain-containing protein 2-like n=1 Tax=Papaver somniferum TaxID=3469 RepID=UPI000E6FB8C5|nr:NAC domain-containing protein 2-like [Papaver somniferum]